MVLFGQRISKQQYKSDQTFDVSFWYKMDFDDGLIPSPAVLKKVITAVIVCVAHLIADRSCIFLLEPSAFKAPHPPGVF